MYTRTLSSSAVDDANPSFRDSKEETSGNEAGVTFNDSHKVVTVLHATIIEGNYMEGRNSFNSRLLGTGKAVHEQTKTCDITALFLAGECLMRTVNVQLVVVPSSEGPQPVPRSARSLYWSGPEMRAGLPSQRQSHDVSSLRYG
jgi:hypothetical protein